MVFKKNPQFQHKQFIKKILIINLFRKPRYLSNKSKCSVIKGHHVCVDTKSPYSRVNGPGEKPAPTGSKIGLFMYNIVEKYLNRAIRAG